MAVAMHRIDDRNLPRNRQSVDSRPRWSLIVCASGGGPDQPVAVGGRPSKGIGSRSAEPAAGRPC